MRRSIRTAAAGIATVGLLATAACGSEDDDNGSDASGSGESGGGNVLEALQASAGETQNASSVEIEMTMTLDDGAGESYDMMVVSGTEGWDPMAADLTVDMSGMMDMMAQEMGGQAPEMPTEIQTRLIDDTMYLHLDFLDQDVEEYTWAGIALDDMAELDPESAQLVEELNQTDMTQSPADQLALFLESSGLEETGTEELNGVEATRYEGTLTTDEMLDIQAEQNDFLSEETLEQVSQDVSDIGAEELDYEVWIDGDDLPVRIDMTMNTQTAESYQYSTVYQDWGSSEGLEAPDEADVVDFRDMEEELGLDPAEDPNLG